MFTFSKVFIDKMDFSGKKNVDIFEKWIHYLILWIILQHEPSIPCGRGGHVKAFKWSGPPPEKIHRTLLIILIEKSNFQIKMRILIKTKVRLMVYWKVLILLKEIKIAIGKFLRVCGKNLWRFKLSEKTCKFSYKNSMENWKFINFQSDVP